MESSKVCVNVMAEFTNDGRLLPRSFIWKDGHVYEIQKVTDVRRAASLKAGGAGIRYARREHHTTAGLRPQRRFSAACGKNHTVVE